MSRFLDANVLLYSISTDPAEARKKTIAIEILAAADNVLSVQVLQEFYVQATRASRRNALSHAVAAGLMEAWSRFPVIETTALLVRAALDLRERRGWSYWDATIVAAALEGGCTELLSEDLNDGQVEGPLTIVSPFRVTR
ncbi:MAG TPA: PIN domain-containing protein [Trueperaceae bacterium]|nr:PIN domain-containing protein [Trueperaceae bacterium]